MFILYAMYFNIENNLGSHDEPDDLRHDLLVYTQKEKSTDFITFHREDYKRIGLTLTQLIV